MVCTRQWRWLWKCSTIAYSNVRRKKKKKRKYNLAIQGGIYCLLAADDRCGRQVESGFTFSFFLRIPPITGNGISGEISLNFGNFDRKVILNSKNEISLHSDRNFGFVDRNFGDLDRNFVFVTVK